PEQFSWMLLKAGLTINGIFEVVTYDSSGIAWKNEAIDWDKLKRAVETQTAFIAEQIFDRTTGNHYKQQMLSGLATASMKLIYRAIQTSRFHVNENCTHCGLCAKNCPTHSIEMAEDHPKWVNTHCMLCMRCVHHCPAEAIDIFNTPGKPRYKKPA
ncbi:MAG: EFR1 family ferrodoxin, partial [Proteobacteria bacterium]|nr:EFR1 family ferrodoxin [Pseudomonadota bacterium]